MTTATDVPATALERGRLAQVALFGSQALPPPAPSQHLDRALYGLMQPVLAGRLLIRHRPLLRAALVPAALLACFCAVLALLDPAGGRYGILRRFYEVFATLAPLPPILLARHYARLAATARNTLGLGPAEVCCDSMVASLRRAIFQVVLIAIAVVPAVLVLKLVPLAGDLLVKALVAGWALHWIVVETFDGARTLGPGETEADLAARAEAARRPWFVRAMERAAHRLPLGTSLLCWFARRCERLARPWREEIALVERHPALMTGFALATAALLATPVLNLLFRPIVLVAATHVLARLSAEGPPDDSAGEAPPAPPPSRP
jgi:hypothetical protein